MAARRRRASLDEDLSEGEEVESKVEETEVLSDKEKAGLVDSGSEVGKGRKGKRRLTYMPRTLTMTTRMQLRIRKN